MNMQSSEDWTEDDCLGDVAGDASAESDERRQSG